MASIDTLEIVKRLRGAGFDDSQAEAITGALRDTHDADLAQIATKEDIAALRSEIAAVRSELRAEIAALRSEVSAEIAALRSELRAEIAALRLEVSADIRMVRSEMEMLRRDLTIRLGGMIVVLTGFLAAIKFLG
jgi:archaellum component FlaC